MNQMKQKNGKERFSIKQYFLKENVKNVMKIYTLLIEWQSPALYIKKKIKGIHGLQASISNLKFPHR